VFARSRVTSGTQLLPTMDGRARVRIMRETLNAIVAHGDGLARRYYAQSQSAIAAQCGGTELSAVLDNIAATPRLRDWV
jgi:hypothetical protein